MDVILKYIEVLCGDAGSTDQDLDPTKVPTIDSPSDALIAYESSNIVKSKYALITHLGILDESLRN